MCRSILALVFVAVTAVGAGAASLPSGTISCQVTYADTFGLRFSPFISRDPSPGRILVKTTMEGSCDDSGVTGGKAPITSVRAKLVGALTAGSSSVTLTSAPNFDRVSLRIKWLTTTGDGRRKPIATSTLRFSDAQWDTDLEGLVFLSTPIKGGFAGSTATVTITLDHPQMFGATSPPIVGDFYGADGDSAITIP